MNLRLDLLAPRLSWRWQAALVAALLVAGFAVWRLNDGLSPRASAVSELESASRQAETDAFTASLVSRQERQLEVARGESLALVLSRADARWEEISAAMTAVTTVFDPRRIRPGQMVNVYVQPDGTGVGEKLMGFAFRADPGAAVTVGRDVNGQFWAREIMTPWSMQTAHVQTKISGSLYQTALAAGATEAEVATFANVFSYDVDFQRDLFPDDDVEMLFDRYYDEDGRTIRTGDMYYIALDTRRGMKSYYFYRGPNEKEGGWYDKDGRSARKFLMQTPVDGARLSSNFGMRRHPILGYSTLHKGVDFAAGTGTPIKAAGDGVIERAGPNGSFGNYIRIQHADRYETAYAHMSRFAAGIRRGVSVRQGQIIGYVGTTGRSTGPHLHYEVLLASRQVNPRNLKLATGRNLGGGELEAFGKERDRIDAVRAGGTVTAPIVAVSAAGELRGGLE